MTRHSVHPFPHQPSGRRSPLWRTVAALALGLAWRVGRRRAA